MVLNFCCTWKTGAGRDLALLDLLRFLVLAIALYDFPLISLSLVGVHRNTARRLPILAMVTTMMARSYRCFVQNRVPVGYWFAPGPAKPEPLRPPSSVNSRSVT